MRRGRRLAGIVALALAARLAPSAFTGHGWDLFVWLKASDFFLNEQINIYSYPQFEGFPWGFYAYPPPWLYLLAGSTYVASLLGGVREVSILFLKLPIILADVFCGLVLWLTAKKLGLGEEDAYKLATLYLLNPLTIFVSSIWGMFDAIPALFTLLALYLLLSGLESAAGASLGLATSFKIYPVIFLPSILLVQVKKHGLKCAITNLLLPFAWILLIVSLPFLGDLPSYLEKLLYHRSNVGQFTYWTLLGIFIGGEIASAVGWALFTAALAITLYKQYADPRRSRDLTTILAGIFTLFLATSPKVNVQYLVLGLPLLLLAAWIHDDPESRREVRKRLTLLHMAALVFMFGSIFIIGYDPANLGKVSNLSLLESGLAGSLILVAAGVAGWESVKLALALNKLTLLKRRLDERAGIASIIVVALIVVTVLPSPAGVRLPPQPVRVDILESPDSIFQVGATSIPQDLYLKLGEPTHVVIPLSPDFFIDYPELSPRSEVSRYFRFRLDSGGWTFFDLFKLVNGLKASGLKVLVGVFTKSKDLLVSYGMQGYESSWFRGNQYLVDKNDRMAFGVMLPLNISLAQFYAQRVSTAVYSIGFDGIYVLSPREGLVSIGDVEWIEPLLVELRAHLDSSKEVFLDGVDPSLGGDAIERLMNYADYIVIRSPIWLREITSEEPRLGPEYMEQLRAVLDELGGNRKSQILYSVNVMDFSSGWLIPAIQVQLQVDTFSSLINRGFVIYFASRYIPYRLTLDSSALRSGA
ncbi:hypothetical protein HRbin02_00485 [Candidatus Calditenuaceae archaeon HR02]|nr:hypothetical protein HRbin02_00485 [Candidatus Calditenuaceae archaeon HR02]